MNRILAALAMALTLSSPGGVSAATGDHRGWFGVIADPGALTIRNGVAGRLSEYTVAIGDPVNPGEIVARIDPEQAAAQLAQMQAQIDAAEAELDGRTATAASLQERLERILTRPDALSASALTEMRADVQTARAEARASEARLAQQVQERKLTQARIAKTELRSPIQGHVIEYLANVGADLSTDAAVLRVRSARPLVLRFAFDPRDDAAPAVGARVRVQEDRPIGAPGSANISHSATVESLSMIVDEDSGLRFAEARLDKPELWMPGQDVRVFPAAGKDPP
ncbi:MAG: biotin/lipoyl-binding protein [Xanthomonadaceae bacterium]|nr:biotin/lipoyl-binding protein [Xanthomonadaceae bacterium]